MLRPRLQIPLGARVVAGVVVYEADLWMLVVVYVEKS